MAILLDGGVDGLYATRSLHTHGDGSGAAQGRPGSRYFERGLGTAGESDDESEWGADE